MWSAKQLCPLLLKYTLYLHLLLEFAKAMLEFYNFTFYIICSSISIVMAALPLEYYIYLKRKKTKYVSKIYIKASFFSSYSSSISELALESIALASSSSSSTLITIEICYANVSFNIKYFGTNKVICSDMRKIVAEKEEEEEGKIRTLRLSSS